MKTNNIFNKMNKELKEKNEMKTNNISNKINKELKERNEMKTNNIFNKMNKELKAYNTFAIAKASHITNAKNIFSVELSDAEIAVKTSQYKLEIKEKSVGSETSKGDVLTAGLLTLIELNKLVENGSKTLDQANQEAKEIFKSHFNLERIQRKTVVKNGKEVVEVAYSKTGKYVSPLYSFLTKTTLGLETIVSKTGKDQINGYWNAIRETNPENVTLAMAIEIFHDAQHFNRDTQEPIIDSSKKHIQMGLTISDFVNPHARALSYYLKDSRLKCVKSNTSVITSGRAEEFILNVDLSKQDGKLLVNNSGKLYTSLLEGYTEFMNEGVMPYHKNSKALDEIVDFCNYPTDKAKSKEVDGIFEDVMKPYEAFLKSGMYHFEEIKDMTKRVRHEKAEYLEKCVRNSAILAAYNKSVADDMIAPLWAASCFAGYADKRNTYSAETENRTFRSLFKEQALAYYAEFGGQEAKTLYTSPVKVYGLTTEGLDVVMKKYKEYKKLVDQAKENTTDENILLQQIEELESVKFVPVINEDGELLSLDGEHVLADAPSKLKDGEKAYIYKKGRNTYLVKEHKLSKEFNIVKEDNGSISIALPLKYAYIQQTGAFQVVTKRKTDVNEFGAIVPTKSEEYEIEFFNQLSNYKNTVVKIVNKMESNQGFRLNKYYSDADKLDSINKINDILCIAQTNQNGETMAIPVGLLNISSIALKTALYVGANKVETAASIINDNTEESGYDFYANMLEENIKETKVVLEDVIYSNGVGYVVLNIKG